MIQTTGTVTENTYANQINLKNSLSEFGLNPNDWLVTEKAKQIYTIENKEDHDFKFLGIAEQNAWKELRLFSI
jgi:hypothetical protein